MTSSVPSKDKYWKPIEALDRPFRKVRIECVGSTDPTSAYVDTTASHEEFRHPSWWLHLTLSPLRYASYEADLLTSAILTITVRTVTVLAVAIFATFTFAIFTTTATFALVFVTLVVVIVVSVFTAHGMPPAPIGCVIVAVSVEIMFPAFGLRVKF